MDRITDHLFIFEWNGVVKDFRWTYSEYKNLTESEKSKNEKEKKSDKNSELNFKIGDSIEKKKLSYMEKRELDLLTKDIIELEKKKDEINRIFDKKDIPYDDIRLLSEELGLIIRQLEQKEYRWFELSSRE